MKLKVYNSDGSQNGEDEFKGIPVFEDGKGSQALKEAVVAEAANARQGSANTKTRGEVSGGGKKPWRQKGTGRARVGSNRSPIWVGGGVVFGPKPRDYSKKTNRKVKALAFNRALYNRAEEGALHVIESLDMESGKTKAARQILAEIVAPAGRVLVLDEAFSEKAVLAMRNLAAIHLQEAATVSVTELCLCDKIVVTRKGIDKLIERAKGGSK